MSVFPRPVHADDVVPPALDTLGPAGRDVRIQIPPDLPMLYADPVLLERTMANVVANAVRFAPPGQPPLVTASSLGNRVEIRVVDHGPGVPTENRDRMFQPFQRLGDTDNSTGTGLGLALSRGLVEAMGGSLTPEETPGGGLTMVVALPTAAPPDRPAVPGLPDDGDEQPQS
jgi:two-component system sensor histidine kinase KdpD